MPGLDDLSKKDVETVVSYTAKKFDSIDAFLDGFTGVLSKLYDVGEYDGGWNGDHFDTMLTNYHNATDRIKREFSEKRIVKITGASVSTVGGVLSMTPLAPVGIFMLIAGGVTNTVTDIVELADKSGQNKWTAARDELKDVVENPFEGTTFGEVYKAMMKGYQKVRYQIPNSDYTVLLQALGWNYFYFRKEGMSHDEAVDQLRMVVDFFKTTGFIITEDLLKKKDEAVRDLQYQAGSLSNLMTRAGVYAIVGFLGGLGFGGLLGGMAVAARSFAFAETIAHGLLYLGNYSMMAFETFLSVPAIFTMIANIAVVVTEAVALANIDETFQPYYDYENTCRGLLEEYKKEYVKANDDIVGMFAFLNKERDAPATES